MAFAKHRIECSIRAFEALRDMEGCVRPLRKDVKSRIVMVKANKVIASNDMFLCFITEVERHGL